MLNLYKRRTVKQKIRRILRWLEVTQKINVIIDSIWLSQNEASNFIANTPLTERSWSNAKIYAGAKLNFGVFLFKSLCGPQPLRLLIKLNFGTSDPENSYLLYYKFPDKSSNFRIHSYWRYVPLILRHIDDDVDIMAHIPGGLIEFYPAAPINAIIYTRKEHK